ncbi:MAG: bifunctional phosphoribosylaminoimidazolecarboxamide formyltransferase/inosine monophosphate cyclohydrolase [Candidatus Cloacimonadota bacterium]|nr:MAG: bifunctional phosphoribosylaminoimidazolecarboxamide formyltransferase/inosine monophosphate cyclohydrolase [Candidatus Cloacimonadota bacterium]PIE77779.1 MAG: bifunctional phosphoribosylaminoimidazolecarboxamide formyltransferase/inosine monophosphate cyclohydrolase [Candidatus Delongbacteria bacterium]
MKRAILSVSDKEGIVDLAKFLYENSVELFSTGGTFNKIKDAGIAVKEVNEITKFPEIMDGRVKTLNPFVHGGILALRDNEEHVKTAKEHNIEFIDLLVVNLYPFESTIAKKDVSLEDVIENIDIGGPTMLRSSAKNYKFVTIVTDPGDYSKLKDEISSKGGTSLEFREDLALKVFRRTSEYDSTISDYLEKRLRERENKTIFLRDGEVLRYGENSHQKASLFKNRCQDGVLATAELIHGKEMSYNNYLDAQGAIDTLISFKKPTAVVVKHNNPCGVGSSNSLRKALELAWYGDPISAMGSVLAFNREFDMETLKFIKGKETNHYSFQVVDGELVKEVIKVGGKFVEVIIAPSFSDEALAYLTKKKNSKNIRLLQVDIDKTIASKSKQVRQIDGGYLYQDSDIWLYKDLECVTEKKFDDDMIDLAKFSMSCCKETKSNAITIARKLDDGSFQLLGMGAGQPNRVDSMRKLAVTKAEENLKLEYKDLDLDISFEQYFKNEMEKCVMASDAFFPFDDTVRTAATFNIKYIIQPGGSMKDQDSIDACNELGMGMIFSKNRHFKH